MTPQELEQYLALTQEIARLEQELETAVKSRQALARTLYERHGKGTSYKVGDEYLIVAPTKTGTYYFAPRVRWPKEARAARAEQKRLDRIARMQRPPTAAQAIDPPAEPVGRRIEITATLTRKATPEIAPDAAEQAYNATAEEIADAALAAAKSRGGSGGVSDSDLAPEDTTPPTPEPTTPLETDQSKRHLPLVGDVDQPTQIEPRLLQIEEPKPEDDSSKPDTSLEEILRDLDDD